MNNNVKMLYAIGAVVILLFSLSGLFIINQNQQAIVLRLGKIEVYKDGSPVIRNPGLNFRIPFITELKVFDIRLQTLDIESSSIVTSEKKGLLVDYYVKWEIANLPAFYKSTGGSIVQTQTLLEQKLNDGIRAEFGKRTIREIVSGGRTEIMKILLEYAKQNVDELGVKICDVRIKRIDLPLEVSAAVFERMKAERRRIATQHRAQGESQAAVIRASADKDVTVIRAQAESKSKTIRGAADALAAQIYSDAYNKDPEFFAFYRSISAYKTIFEKGNDVMVLKPNSHFFRYFKSIGAP